jgi:hypothetical protein
VSYLLYSVTNQKSGLYFMHFLTLMQDLKYDNCNVPTNWTDTCSSCEYDISAPQNYVNRSCVTGTGYCQPGYNYSQSNSAERYRRMRDALLQQNRTILYSLCSWGTADVTTWGNSTGSSWRMSGDITGEGSPHLRTTSLEYRGYE